MKQPSRHQQAFIVREEGGLDRQVVHLREAELPVEEWGVVEVRFWVGHAHGIPDPNPGIDQK